MKTAFQDVADFHIACDQPVRIVPQLISPEEVALRKNLINEEVNKELFPAMDSGDLAEIADALGDTIYVILGTAHHYGIPMEPVWNAIQRSNMAKVDPLTGRARKRDDGKVLKPEGWTAPDVTGILRDNGWDA